MPIPNEIASEPRMTPISDGVMFIIYGQYHSEPNVKAHPTVPGASVVCGNVDGIPERVKLVAGHRSACSVLLVYLFCG